MDNQPLVFRDNLTGLYSLIKDTPDKPNTFNQSPDSGNKHIIAPDPDCLFCPGLKESLNQTTYAIGDPWSLRAFNNK